MFSSCRNLNADAHGGSAGDVDHPVRRVVGLALALVSLVAFSTTASSAEQRVLRVASDPNNLPFSNERGEGFENEIAELVARELGARLEYMWWPQRRGFFRETIGAGRADLVVGVPEGFERVLSTRPYYRSTYVFVNRKGRRNVRSLDDPTLQKLVIGVQLIGDDAYNAPPAHALSARGMVQNIHGFTVYGNYGRDSPPADIIRAVAADEVDVAVAWGPMAGYFASRQSVPLEITPISPEEDGPVLKFTFPIATGVRRGDAKLKSEIDAVIERRADALKTILDRFGVPQLPLNPQRLEHEHVANR